MAVFRIEKTRDYTVMSNHHLRNTNLSLKAKGLLSLMLSLPENWDYTTKGLARICKDGVDSICAGVRELEEQGYVIRERVRNPNGQLGAIEYTILEQPRPPEPKQEKPERENPVQANPVLGSPVLEEPEQENPAQLNTKKSSKETSKTDLSITEPSNPIQSNPSVPAEARMGMDGMGAREAYREVIFENIGYEYLIQNSHIDREQLDEIAELIVDTVFYAYGQKGATTMTKPREKTREELQAEIEDGKKKIRQFENREKMLRQKLSKEERRTRSHRLIVRGAVFESIVPEAKNMTDEEATALLRLALTSEPAREYLKKRAESRNAE